MPGRTRQAGSRSWSRRLIAMLPFSAASVAAKWRCGCAVHGQAIGSPLCAIIHTYGHGNQRRGVRTPTQRFAEARSASLEGRTFRVQDLGGTGGNVVFQGARGTAFELAERGDRDAARLLVPQQSGCEDEQPPHRFPRQRSQLVSDRLPWPSLGLESRCMGQGLTVGLVGSGTAVKGTWGAATVHIS